MPTPKFCKATLAGLLLAILLQGQPARAQDDEPEDTSRLPRTVIKALKYADVADLKHLVELVGVEAEVDPKRKLMVLRGPDYDIETALKLADALDSPEPRWGIDFYVHVIEASKEATKSRDLPKGLETAFADLTERFGYRGYQLLDSFFLHANRDTGGAQLQTTIGDDGRITIHLDMVRVVYGEPKNLIRVENLIIRSEEIGLELRTNVEMRDGHRLLIGKTRRRGYDTDIVLAIEAHLQDAWKPDTDG